MTEPNDSTSHGGEQDHKLDQMLDSMLSEYSSVEPRPGLETRILANVRDAAAVRRAPWRFIWIWAGASTVAALVILLFVVYLSQKKMQPAALPVASRPLDRKGPPPQTPRQIAPPVILSNETPLPRTLPRTTTARPAHPSGEVAEVRQEVFPSRSPLSEQEKLLFRYLERTPHEEIVAQSHVDPQGDGEDDGQHSHDDRPNNLTQIHQQNSNTR
jgi:hypothetical protein